jgi:hypothetical protein
MYLKSGRIQKKLYPGGGGVHSEEIDVNPNVRQLKAVMNGFEIQFDGRDNHIQKMCVNLSVAHETGQDKASLKCSFNLQDENTSGDAFWALCDYVLIGKLPD